MKSWYLIYSKSQQEKLAKENLERQGYVTYLPLISIRKKRKGSSRIQFGPMFPRYLFIYLSDEIDNWGPIRSTMGVVKLIQFGQTAAKVPDKLISVLKSREDENGIQIIEHNTLKYKDKIRVTEGVFEGYEGIYQANSSGDRVVVLMQILEKQVRLEIDRGKIENLP